MVKPWEVRWSLEDTWEALECDCRVCRHDRELGLHLPICRVSGEPRRPLGRIAAAVAERAACARVAESDALWTAWPLTVAEMEREKAVKRMVAAAIRARGLG